jgi:hypothetical protein
MSDEIFSLARGRRNIGPWTDHGVGAFSIDDTVKAKVDIAIKVPKGAVGRVLKVISTEGVLVKIDNSEGMVDSGIDKGVVIPLKFLREIDEPTYKESLDEVPEGEEEGGAGVEESGGSESVGNESDSGESESGTDYAVDDVELNGHLVGKTLGEFFRDMGYDEDDVLELRDSLMELRHAVERSGGEVNDEVVQAMANVVMNPEVVLRDYFDYGSGTGEVSTRPKEISDDDLGSEVDSGIARFLVRKANDINVGIAHRIIRGEPLTAEDVKGIAYAAQQAEGSLSPRALDVFRRKGIDVSEVLAKYFGFPEDVADRVSDIVREVVDGYNSGDMKYEEDINVSVDDLLKKYKGATADSSGGEPPDPEVSDQHPDVSEVVEELLQDTAGAVDEETVQQVAEQVGSGNLSPEAGAARIVEGSPDLQGDEIEITLERLAGSTADAVDNAPPAEYSEDSADSNGSGNGFNPANGYKSPGDVKARMKEISKKIRELQATNPGQRTPVADAVLKGMYAELKKLRAIVDRRVAAAVGYRRMYEDRLFIIKSAFGNKRANLREWAKNKAYVELKKSVKLVIPKGTKGKIIDIAGDKEVDVEFEKSGRFGIMEPIEVPTKLLAKVGKK